MIWINARVGIYMCNRCGTYLLILDQARINIHQGSYLISLLLILASSVACVEMRLQSTIGIYITECHGTKNEVFH